MTSFSPFSRKNQGLSLTAELFAEIVGKSGHSVALSDAHRQLNYNELDSISNRVANYLVDHFPHDNRPVLVYMDRSLEAVVVILGIVKTGRAYLPVDKSYSVAQLDYISQDSHASVVISDQHLETELTFCLARSLLEYENDAKPNTEYDPKSPAYIMYTSGSTGLPKGVKVDHSGIIRLVVNANYINSNGLEATAHCSSIGFDASTFEIWYPLLNGGRIYVIDKQDVLDFERLEQQLIFGGVETLWLTVALFNTIFTHYPNALSHLKNLLIGGDALNIELVRQFMSSPYCHLTSFINGYGPTENTTFTTTYDIFQLSPDHSSVPIGKPINGTQVMIVSDHGNAIVDGEVGELWVSGLGLAQGYTCEQETKKKFVEINGCWYYKTGDLVRRLPCGNLEFIARKDHEVKIRGLRVNLSQVEQILQEINGINVCYIRPDPDQANQTLVAYIEVSPAEIPLTPSEINTHLAQRLPRYMIPERMVLLNAIPLTRNGKVDINAIESNIQSTQDEQCLQQADNLTNEIERLYRSLLPQAKQAVAECDFFELGGSSLQIYEVIHNIASNFGVRLRVDEFLKHSRAVELALLVRTKMSKGETNCESVETFISARVPMSPAQKRLWYIEQLNEQISPNLLVFGYRLDGEIDANNLQVACRAVVENNEALQTVFCEAEGEVFQESSVADVDFIILTDRCWQAVYAEEVKQPINLSVGPLIRFRFITNGTDQHTLLIFSTHLALDGWSVKLLIQQLSAYYENLSNGLPLSGKTDNDYLSATRQMLAYRASPRFKDDLSYWASYLNQCVIPTIIPRAESKIAVNQQNHREKNQYSISLSKELMRSIYASTQRENISLFSYLLFYFGKTLADFAVLDEVVVAVPVANREEFAQTIGMFVNTIPVRLNYKDNLSLSDAHKNILQCLQHSQVYLDEMTHNNSDVNLHSLQTGIVLQNSGHDNCLEIAGCESRFMKMPIEQAMFDLFCHCTLVNEGMLLTFEYNSDYIYSAYVKSLMALFKQHLMASAGYPCEPDIPSRLAQLVTAPSLVPIAFEACLNNVFEQRASAIAVVDELCEYSFSQMSKDISRTRHFLNEQGVQPGMRIGVTGIPSYQYIVAIFSILLNRCSFVPLDPHYPNERLSFIIDDAEIYGTLLINIDDKPSEERRDFDHASFDFSCNARSPLKKGRHGEACVLYTSGSTGTPKGVEICIDSIMRLAQSPNFLQLTSNDRFLVTSSPAFDASLLEIFVPLLNGASCGTVAKETLLDYEKLETQLKNKEINTAWLTVSLFNDIASSRPQALQSLDNLLIGGDALDITIVRAFMSSPYCRLKQFVNGYGPTECTTFSTWFNIFNLTSCHTCVPIGKPINDTFVYVLDSEMILCHPGQVGEIAIGAPWLRPNYNRREALNSEKFVSNPYYHFDDCRYLYLSGDIARYNGTMDVEYIGRRDKMVKIRGNRVELSGINKVISGHPKIKNSHVCVVERDVKMIFAYVVKRNSVENDASLRVEILSYLRSKLEPFQVPSVILFVEEIPLTVNGKVDTKCLPIEAITPINSVIAPKSELEKQLHAYWLQLLGIDDFCIHDRFFDIGGHSLLVPKIVHHIFELTGIKLSFIEVIEYQTVFKLSEYLGKYTEQHQGNHGNNLVKTKKQSYLATSQQLNLYFSNEMASNKSLYNIPVSRCFSRYFEVERLKKTVEVVFKNERVLNFKFGFDNNEELVMVRQEESQFKLSVFPLLNKEDAYCKMRELAEKVFDLHDFPLIECCYLPLKNSAESFLFINVHHIIADEMSLNHLFSSIVDYYDKQYLPKPHYDYLDYCEYMHIVTARGSVEKSHTYWSEAFKNYQGKLKFTTKERTNYPDHLCYRQRFRLQKQHVESIKKLAYTLQCSVFEVTFALYQRTVGLISGQDDIVVAFPYSPRVDLGITDVVGYFVDLLPVRTQFERWAEWSLSLLKELVRNNRLYIKLRPATQTIPFISDIRRHEYYAPLVQNVFSFHQTEENGAYGLDVDLDNPYCRFDTVFNMTYSGGGIIADLECARDIYSTEILPLMFNTFVSVIEQTENQFMLSDFD
ncbi:MULTISPECIES: AMP-binding protein [unclassified Brenneria]|uniref:AMP-binding protein n=1 Tax=unclassified Brenneria TaxID=2634434 RepID=UPI0018F0A66E|nr:AMP-binding protein [Brenneria sp. L3-3C-1]MBJ7224072.1 AMP-binding protein [Brenneria sp. L3-3C-1]MEE3645318.1 AMP-binding protein [Brenneria sp. L3_3C_1]